MMILNFPLYKQLNMWKIPQWVQCCFSYQHIRNFHNNNRTLKIKETLSLSTCRGLADNHGEDHHNITVIAVSGNYSVIKDAHLAVNISTFVTFKV